ncbi:DUF2911 domain-containing protein [Flavobacteriaceae bacterium AU392]|nr:DUF2911 domain-containing protein [Flavobacteriaceae bacterium]RKM81297.1 DUF2911 domain-containing protein [Flavobacteriaceae bacterium AU392]
MKKSSLITIMAFAFVMLLSTNVNAQQFPGLDKSPLDLASFPSRGANKIIKVFYSRPYLKGRTIGTQLAPYGKLWRTGANDATQIQFLQDVKFGGKSIKAGAYSLFTIPGEKEWTIIISSDLDHWATSGYKESNEVARLTVPVTKGDQSLENFSIAFQPVDNGAHMHLGWGTVRVAVPFTK